MRNRSKIFLGISLAAATAAFADLAGSYVVPLDDEAIQYAKRAADDPVERLNRKIARGEIKLEFDQTHGYLRSALRALGIPVESQVLVFSKTSFQPALISPQLPRALYFNDSTAVGSVHSSDLLEFASVDPKLGVVFYTLNQEKVDKPHFDRRDAACLQCHDAGGPTLGVPGLIVRSVYPDPSGMPVFQAGDFYTDDRSPLKDRWGGWYVTGTHGEMTHMGNAVVRDHDHPENLEGAAGLNVTNLSGKFETRDYLTPHSDIVALMTLEHQSRMTNLITRVGYETAIALRSQAAFNQAYHQPADELSDVTRHRIDSAVEQMVQYMFFLDEAKLDAPIQGTSGFAEAFQKAGLHDRKGRSLRDFDLRERMFRYPLSYMIYTEAFDRMPAGARERIYRRLFDVLTEKEKSPRYGKLSSADRRAILEILSDTKKGLPDYWKAPLAAQR
ncbi:MAG: hypothetical protein ABI833_02225 [Acidobacteriota bacterium]